MIPFVAFAITALLWHVRGEPVRQVWRRGARLWVGASVLTAAWVAVYIAVVDQRRWSTDLTMTWDLLRRSVTHGIVPGVVGGPWRWERWAPASPWATPPLLVMILGWLALAALLTVSLWRKRRIGMVWFTAGYAVACQVPIYLMRSSRFTALELAQTLRYLPDLVVVLALCAAVALCAPNREASRWLDRSVARTAVIVGIAIAFVTSSVVSTASFLKIWRDNPTQSYLHNAERGLALAHSTSDAPLLDQEVDPMVLERVAWPENLASHMFAALPERPEFAAATNDLRMLDVSGRLVPAKVTWVRTIVAGPVAQCGYFVQTDTSAGVRMALDGPLLPAEWTAEINYLANSEGSLTMSLSEGHDTKVLVHPGLNRVFVRLSGGRRGDQCAGQHRRPRGVHSFRACRVSGAGVMGRCDGPA